jgi:hypothetical protein
MWMIWEGCSFPQWLIASGFMQTPEGGMSLKYKISEAGLVLPQGFETAAVQRQDHPEDSALWLLL